MRDIAAPNIKDRLIVDLGSKVYLEVRAEPRGRNTWLHLSLAVPEGRAVQLTSSVIGLTQAGSSFTETITIDKIESIMNSDGNGPDLRTYQPMETLDGGRKYPRGFYVNMRVEDFRPSRFEMKIPALIVNGNVVGIPPITFTLHRGVLLYQQ